MNNEEIWLPIKGFKGLYEVSNTGLVRSLKHTPYRLISPYTTEKGYLKVGLSVHGKVCKYRVHRLVAEAFLPNIDKLPQINHIDGDKTNNNIDNLEWCDQFQNMRHAYNMGLGGRSQRHNICGIYEPLGFTKQQIGRLATLNIPYSKHIEMAVHATPVPVLTAVFKKLFIDKTEHKPQQISLL